MTFKKLATTTTLLVACLAAQPSLAASCQDDANALRNDFYTFVYQPTPYGIEDYYGNPVSKSEAIAQFNTMLASIVSNSDGTCVLTAYGETTSWQAGHPDLG
jgi:hypothetical protein